MLILVNGERSDHTVYGWGGPGGRVYQKAYVEFFVDPQFMPLILSVFKKYNNLSVYAVDSSGTALHDSAAATAAAGGAAGGDHHADSKRGVTAVTWGVFPDKEILQPTIFDPDTFIVWSREAFELWTQAWATIYDDESESCSLLYEVRYAIMPRSITI